MTGTTKLDFLGYYGLYLDHTGKELDEIPNGTRYECYHQEVCVPEQDKELCLEELKKIIQEIGPGDIILAERVWVQYDHQYTVEFCVLSPWTLDMYERYTHKLEIEISRLSPVSSNLRRGHYDLRDKP